LQTALLHSLVGSKNKQTVWHTCVFLYSYRHLY